MSFKKIFLRISYLKFFGLIFLCFYGNEMCAQECPQNYFRNPLNIPIELAADFGEIRPNHFHMGLDIRTQSKENLPVYAAADGYVSRIKIEKSGFGRAIYITHPAGYVTVYAHLNNFFPALNDYVIQKQYNEQSWEQDFTLAVNAFPVRKGQFIAYSGNTGSSQGPHLHFEVRDANTGNNINPEFFGLVNDNITPTVYDLYWYNRDYSTYVSSPLRILLKKLSTTNFTATDTFKTSCSKISFGIRTEDKNKPAGYFYGIFRGTLWMDDSVLNNFELRNFSYDSSRYINACIDYETYINTRKGIQHLSILPGNKLNIFSASGSDGVVLLNDTMPHKITIEVADRTGNSACINFIVKHDNSIINNDGNPYCTKVCSPNKENFVETENAIINFSANAFYDTVPFMMHELPMQSSQQVSNTIQFHNNSVPVHDYYTAQIKTWLMPDNALRNKCVMQLASGNDTDTEPCKWQGDYCAAKFRNLGTAKVLVDTAGPVITVLSFKNNAVIKKEKSISVKCYDEVSSTKSFMGILDGNWLLFSKKGNTCTYFFDEHCPPGKHCLQLFATDEVGNTTEKDFVFTKQ